MNFIFNIDVKGSDELKFIDNPKEDKNGKKDNKVKKALKKQITAALVAVGIKLIPLILIITIITSVIEWVVKIFQPKNTVNQIYKKLEIDDVHDLIQIKGNNNDGYYLDFADGIDDKLDETIEYLDSTAGVKSGINKDFLKKTIKAEVCTQFPDLGGKVPENTSGFQGIVDILRITPNKDINSLKNTGVGEETIKNQDEVNDVKITNEDEIKKEEDIIKGWEKGKELTISATAYVYSQEDSKLHEGEKIDYWTPQKNSETQEDLEVLKGQTVKYTGNYSKSVDKMTNEGLIYVEIEKDEIKGYIKCKFIQNSSDNNETTAEQLENAGYEEVEEEKVVDTIDSNVYKLTYLPKETFDSYVKNANKEALYHFTIDDDGNLTTATWSYSENGLKITNNSSINLKTALQNYILPSAYLLYFYIEADYEDFSSDLADVALNSEIILALEDNITTTKVDETNEEKKVSISSEYSKDWHSISSKSTQTEYCSTNTEIIYADTWCVKLVNKDIYRDELLNVGAGESINIHMPGTVTDTTTNAISPETETGSGNDTKTVTETKEENIFSHFSQSGQPVFKTETVTRDITYTYSYKLYQRTLTDTHSISNSYASSSKEIEPESKEEVFVDLYKTHQMYNRINDKRFLQILENDSKTANMVNITKYLMYMATGTDYGVKEYDFSIYSNTDFSSVSSSSSSDLLVRYIHAWEHSTPPPTNADGTKYIIESDGYGHPTVGYGIDIYNSGYLSLFQAAGYPTNIGGEVDKDFVDSLETKIIEGKTNGIKAALSGINLKDYQLNALISRAYNCGTSGATGTRNGKTFSQAYNAYWNEDKDDYFKNKNKNADFNNKLYTQYMNLPVTSKGIYSSGLERRRKSEWTLFQTGYYDVLDEWHSDISGGSIVEIAKVIHEYMEKNNYSYCVYGGNSYEECSKYNQSHGLNKTFEQSKTGYKHSCCATFVSWVLQEAGYISDSEHLDGANALQTKLKNKGFKIISNESDLQAGDILCYPSHVEIYAGNNTIYNAGSGNAIRNSSPQKRTRSFGYALRAPK